MKEHTRENKLSALALIDGKAVDAGIFYTDLTGLIKMKNTFQANAFGVLIEPYSGKDSPTLETLQVIGNVRKS